MKTSTLFTLLLMLLVGITRSQELKPNESEINRKGYSIYADKIGYIHFRLHPEINEKDQMEVKVELFDLRSRSLAVFIANRKKATEDEQFVFNTGETGSIEMEYLVELTINGKKYKEEIEFPH